jgi:hypothetical protein
MAADNVEPTPHPGSASLLDERGYTHERALYLAQLALAAGRHSDACAFITALVKNKSAAKLLLSESERQLFSQAFKQQLAGHRGTLKLLELVAEHEQYPLHLTVLDVYARQMESGVLDLARTVLSLIVEEQVPVCEDALHGGPPPALPQLASPAGSSSVSPEAPAAVEGAAAPAADRASAAADSARTGGSAAAVGESSVAPEGSASATAVVAPNAAPSPPAVAQALVFWFKLAADYCRYVSESARDAAVVARHSDLALSYYSKARSHGALRLHPASPAVLGVSLNFTVFLYEIRRCEEEARELAEAALVAAEEALAADSASTAATATSPESALAGAAGPEAALAGSAAAVVAAAREGASPVAYAALTPGERAESGAVRALIAENLRLWREEDEDAAAAAAAAAAGASEAGRPGVHEGAFPAAGHTSGAAAMPQGSVGVARR